MLKKIRVGACTYTIKELLVNADEGFVGRCHPNSQLIEIEGRLPSDKKKQTLLHEVIHAINFEYGNLRLSERNTDIFATALLSLFKDNPKFKAWL